MRRVEIIANKIEHRFAWSLHISLFARRFIYLVTLYTIFARLSILYILLRKVMAFGCKITQAVIRIRWWLSRKAAPAVPLIESARIMMSVKSTSEAYRPSARALKSHQMAWRACSQLPRPLRDHDQHTYILYVGVIDISYRISMFKFLVNKYRRSTTTLYLY